MFLFGVSSFQYLIGDVVHNSGRASMEEEVAQLWRAAGRGKAFFTEQRSIQPSHPGAKTTSHVWCLMLVWDFFFKSIYLVWNICSLFSVVGKCYFLQVRLRLCGKFRGKSVKAIYSCIEHCTMNVPLLYGACHQDHQILLWVSQNDLLGWIFTP